MDRNLDAVVDVTPAPCVATREGGVDRNDKKINALAARHSVATREGGVDRNIPDFSVSRYDPRSPPARVAWIETHWLS